MVVTLKLISTAVCYQDGLARPEVRTSLSNVNCVCFSALCSLLPRLLCCLSVFSQAMQRGAVASGARRHA